MKNNNFTLLNNWLLSLNLKEEESPTLKDIHIDELLKKPGSLLGGQKDKFIFFRSLELFYDLICFNFGYDLKVSYVPTLVFHLRCSNKVLFNVKKNIWSDFSRTPPSIYLIPKIDFLIIDETEEYKKPLNLDVFKNFQDCCVIYYRCFRTIEDIKNNWEYSRAIYIENFGKRNP